MKCETVQEFILEDAPVDEGVLAHLTHCEGCREFFALQRTIDEKLTRAYVAPAVSRDFRDGVRAKVRAEQRRNLWDATASLLAPAVGLVTSAVCAMLVPEIAGLALAAGVGLSAMSYVGQLLFTWLTEELGEG